MFLFSISYVNILPILYTGQPISLFVVIVPLIGNTTLILFLGPGYKKRQRATLPFNVEVMPHSLIDDDSLQARET